VSESKKIVSVVTDVLYSL